MNHPPDREETIFEAALQLPPAQRTAHLQQACGEDAPLRQRIELLLKSHEQASGDFLEQPHSLGSKKTIVVSLPPLAEELLGTMIGRYKLLEKIGEGGFGVVYVAEQREPVKRRVALKIIKLGMDTKQVVARFEVERQALALMDHPNIAKVFDAGATEKGRPYFVMELVRGIRITDYCNQNHLATRERLELFAKVCQAIQHAHQKGIIHCDIKPSNLLVTLHDGVPVPKVIDFGIAKATQGELSEHTVYTQLQQFIGTPAYMSPEQAEMSGLDIDTRTDIYALGVLLYELLTGKTPLDQKDLLSAGLDGMRRMIREQEPQRPSTRVSSLQGEDRTTTATRHSLAAPKLAHLLQGDLDWIVMKCLEKDRTRRYETANGVAADIQRHLSNEPVVARPPSNLYRFQKLVRRNKLAVVATSAVATALVLGMVVSTWQAVRATRAEREQSRLRQQAQANEKKAEAEAAKSQQVAQFMKDMLKGVGPSVALGRDTTMLREILDRTVERVGKDLTNQPEVEVELRSILTLTYEELWLFKQREEMARETLRVSRSRLGEEHPAVADALHQIGDARSRLGDQTGAEEFMREAVTLKRKVLGNEHSSTAASLNVLAWVVMRQNKFNEAEMLGREALAIRRKRFGNEHRDIADSIYLLGMVMDRQGKLAEAESLYREALAMQRKVLGEEHPTVAESLDELASVLRLAGKLAESETMHREALARRRKLFSPDHPEVAESLNNLAAVLKSQGKQAEVETLYREELASRRNRLGNEHPAAANALLKLGDVLRDSDQRTEAEAAFREAVAICRKQFGNEHPELPTALDDLAIFLRHQGKLREAEPLFREAIILFKQLMQENPQVTEYPTRLGHSQWELGQVLNATKRPEEAEQVFLEALQVFERAGKDFPTEPFLRQEQAFSHRYLAGAANARGRVADAERHYRAAIALYAALAAELPQNPHYAREEAYTIGVLAGLLERTGRPEAAATEFRQASARVEKAMAQFPDSSALKSNLAELLRAQGKLAEAETLWREEAASRKRHFGEVHRSVEESLAALAKVLQQAGKLAEAETVWREELAMEQKLSGNDHPFVDTSLRWLASVLAELAEKLLVQQKFADAERPARECVTIREKQLPDDWRTFNARSLLGGSLLGQKKYADAEPLLLSGYEGMKQREDKIPANGKIRLQAGMQRLGELYAATSQSGKAAEWKTKLAEFDQNGADNQPAALSP